MLSQCSATHEYFNVLKISIVNILFFFNFEITHMASTSKIWFIYEYYKLNKPKYKFKSLFVKSIKFYMIYKNRLIFLSYLRLLKSKYSLKWGEVNFKYHYTNRTIIIVSNHNQTTVII